MLFKLLDVLVGYIKETPAWPVLRPVVALLSFYVTGLVLVYQFVEWQYGLSPPLSLFMRSYLVKQVSVVCAALGLILFLLSRVARTEDAAKGGPPARLWRMPGRPAVRMVVVVTLVAAGATALFSWLAPRPVANVRVKFLAEPEIDRYAVAYLLYELNRAQKQWFFEVDFDVFNENALTSGERRRCQESDRALCFAETLAKNRPFIGITTDSLGEDFFWQNRGPVSVVSTYGWRQYAPPSEYEFLTYAIIVQSVLIHLNAHCTGLPTGAFLESRISVNDLFQFSPRRNAMKAVVLASHMDRRGELLLFNCLGPEYVAVAGKVLTLDWLRTGRVHDNLDRVFRVKVPG